MLGLGTDTDQKKYSKQHKLHGTNIDPKPIPPKKSGKDFCNLRVYPYFSSMNPKVLQTPILYLKGVGPNRAETLGTELDIHTYGDLLNLFPNRYLDKTQYYKINQLQRNSAEVQIIGKIVHLKTVEQKKGSRLVATFMDETGQM